MEPIVVILMLIVLVIAVLGGGTGTAVAPPPASVAAPSRGQDWLQIAAVIFLLGIVGLTLLGLVLPMLAV
jgi:hypothetical protein